MRFRRYHITLLMILEFIGLYLRTILHRSSAIIGERGLIMPCGFEGLQSSLYFLVSMETKIFR